jgi:hypothetical protein
MGKLRFEDLRKTDTKVDTNINSSQITVYVRSNGDMPEELEILLNNMINKAVDTYEHDNKTEIDINKIDMEATVTADTENNNLVISVYLGYSETNEMIQNELVVPSDNACYPIFKGFYIAKLTEYALNRITEIKNSID